MIVKQTLKAWLTDHSRVGPEELARGELGDVHFLDLDMARHGWTYVGEAEVALDLLPRDEIVDNKVSALKAEIEEVQAKAQNQITILQGRINELLALPMYEEV